MGRSCAQWRGEIGAYIVGALDRCPRDRVIRHLAACVGCRADYDELVPVRDWLRLLAVTAGGAATAGPRPLAEPLRQSELRVLRYLPTKLTAPEIASELSVSLNTVKTHMRNLYAKLGAHRRAEAVTRARDLGLLTPPARSAR